MSCTVFLNNSTVMTKCIYLPFKLLNWMKYFERKLLINSSFLFCNLYIFHNFIIKTSTISLNMSTTITKRQHWCYHKKFKGRYNGEIADLNWNNFN